MHDLDISVFKAPSQTTEADRKSLVMLQHLVRNQTGCYVYLELGSHLGGSLVPHMIDGACRLVYSIDKRPSSQLDERGVYYDYADNSAQRMLEVLRSVVGEAPLLKVIPVDKDMADISADDVGCQVDLVLIDGEHTNTAVFRDFIGVLKVVKPSCIVAFHDSHLVCDALQNIEELLVHKNVTFRSFFLPDVVFVIAIGEFAHTAGNALQRTAFDRQTFIERARLTRWKAISAHANLIKEDKIGHLSAL
jgi:hypothetical protein